ncbi:hypothetical protein FQN57_003547 [Myotisia sp. PD_48]|nr:hypothetical protein FQN57_003547 [Myotisia sp. PD_48]
MTCPPSEVIGAAGCRYLFKRLIQERPHLGRVWLATSGQHKFILKDIPKSFFSSFNEDIWPRLREKSRYLRLPHDTIPGQQNVFVYKYMDSDLLSLVRTQLPLQARKQILKATLQGIAELHNNNIVHLDIKPDNIMVNYRGTGLETIIEHVQIIDLENATYLPKGRCIKGMLPGNDSWRSPEGHFKVIFGTDDDLLKHESQGAFPHIIRLQRQVSFFGDQEGLNGLMRHVGDYEVNCQVLELLWEDRVADYHCYRPFLEWPNVPNDDVFKDLIRSMTILDPQKRVTAQQALEHPWVSGCEID